MFPLKHLARKGLSSDSGLLPLPPQAISWNNAALLSIASSATTLIEILIEIQ